MARLHIPKTFNGQNKLLNAIIAKHTADGAGSVLTSFLIQKNIDLTACATIAQTAAEHEKSRAAFTRQSASFRQMRDNNFNPVFIRTKKGAQFLKTFYGDNSTETGLWGLPVTGSNGITRINYPSNFPAKEKIFNQLAERHNSFDAGSSPLQPYLDINDIDLAADATVVAIASGFHDDFVNASRLSENETEQRDLLWKPLLKNIKNIGAFLMKLFSANPKKLALWGFTVDDAPRKPKLRNTKLKPGQKITCNAIIIGGIFTNTGMVNLYVYKGKLVNDISVVVPPGEEFGIKKGYSIITVMNISTLQMGKFKVLTSK